MIIYITEDNKSAYSIDDEGTLYYTPISESGAIRLDDWVDVDFYSMDDDLIDEAKEVQEKLIVLHKANGTYFTGPLKVSQ